ncbi:MAG TPA: CHASE3 domain-containing protein [Micromonosporaceae bacterium]
MSGRRSWTLRQRVTALCVVVAVALVGLAGAETMLAARNRGNVDNLVNKTGPLRAHAEELLSAFVNQETGVRGYAVTGKPVDLKPYEDGVQQERVLIGQMDKLLADDPQIRAELRQVEASAERWRGTVARPAIAAAATNTRAAQALLTDQARRLFDDIRTEMAELQQAIIVLRNGVADDARRTGDTLAVLLLIAAAVVVLAGTVLLFSLNRLVIGPVTGLAEQVRGIAGGDYQRAIEASGPPELAGLGRDVDAMRRKIAADLAEVREARARIEWVNSQLEKQAEELVRSNRDLEQFAYVASHDLQEPLRKVSSFCQLLQRRYAGQLDERADQYIAFAVDGAQRMQRLINDLLAFSRIGRITAGFTEVDLNRVMGDVQAQTEAARQYTDAEVTWSDLPVVQGEESLLENLLANLVSNSLKFRRPDVPPRVHISAHRVGDEWEITCQDNGIGIEPEFADKIFVIFQRLHAKDAYPGTGIGLAIVKKIVEYHGGRVWVDSDVPEGTAIHFTLPMTADQLAAVPPTEERSDADRAAEEGTAGEPPTEEGPAEEGAAAGAAADGLAVPTRSGDDATSAAASNGGDATSGLIDEQQTTGKKERVA